MEVARIVERIERVDVASASVGQLASLMGDLGRLKGWVGSTEAAAAHRAGELERAGEASSASDLISRGTKTSRRTAEKTQRRGDALAQAPGFGQQLASGRISTEHADALATAAGKLDDEQRDELFGRNEELAERAVSETPVQFARTLAKVAAGIALDDGIERSEQQRRSASLSHGINSDTGMGWIRAELHPDDYQKVKRRLDAEVNAMKRLPEYEGRRYEQLAAEALVSLVTGGRAVSRVPAEVTVLLDYQTLVDGVHADTVSEYSDGSPLHATLVTPRSSRQCWIPLGCRSTLDAALGTQRRLNGRRCERCIEPALSTGVTSGSIDARCITSSNGTISATPTSRISCRCVVITTIGPTKVGGDCNSIRAPANSACSTLTAACTVAAGPT